MLQKMRMQFKASANRINALMMSICLVAVSLMMPFTSLLKASAENTANITAMHLCGWNTDAGVDNKVTVEQGKTYTFTVLWKYVCGAEPLFQIGGDAIGDYKHLIHANKVQSDEIKFDRDTGKISYTFVSKGTNFIMGAGLGSPSTSGGKKEFYFAQPTIFESDADGKPVSGGAVIDCDPEFDNSWPHWGYGGDYRHVEQVSYDFFNGESAVAISELDVGYKLSPEFYHSVHEYSVTIPHTVDKLDIKYKLVKGATLKDITGNEGFEEGITKDVVISVNDSTGAITTYTIHVTKAYNPENIITAMHISEWTDAGVENTVTVEKGKTYTFTFLWKHIEGIDNNFKVLGDAIGVTKFLIIANEAQPDVNFDLITGKVSYTFVSKGTTLTMATLQGYASGHKDYYFAQPTLFESDSEGNPVIGGAEIDCDPEFDNSWPIWSYGGPYRKVEGVPINFFEKTDFPHALTSLDIGYDISPEFDYRKYTYDVTVPYSVNELDIKYDLFEGTTLNQITGNSGFEDGMTKKVVISVNDDAGGITNYTIRVKREVEPTAALTSLSVGYELTPVFDSKVYNYTVSVPNSVEELTVNHSETENTIFKSVVGNTGLRVGIPTDVVITVANTQGIEIKYTIVVTRQGAGGDTSLMEETLKNAASTITCLNSTTANDLNNALAAALGSEYTVAVADFYKMSAVSGARDDDGVIVPGINGYISAVINLTNGVQLAELPLIISIEAPMTEYSFDDSEISKTSDFEIEDDGKYLSAYTGTAKKIVIPEGVEEIGFGWNQAEYPENAVALVIPDSVKVLPDNLAYGMRHLEAVYMGDGVTELPSGAFDRCIFLQHVRLSENLRNIGGNAFAGTCSLSDIRLPEGLKTIEAKAFFFSMVRNITIPAGVETIGEDAFASPFSAVYQLVSGSDNEYFMFVFQSIDDPDCKRLADISNQLVDYTDSKGNVYKTYEEAPIGVQWGNDNPWPNGAVYVTPRAVTVLGTGTQIGKNAFYTSNGFYSGGVNVRLPNGSSSFEIVNKCIDGLEAKRQEYLDKTENKLTVSVVGLTLDVLDMYIAEAAARVQFMADNLIINDSSTAASVAEAVKSAFSSTTVFDSIDWKQAFKISEATATNPAMATGIMTVKNGKVEFDIILNVALKNLVTPDESEKPSDKPNIVDTSIPKNLIPLTIVKGSRLAFMNWDNGIMTILRDKTIKQFLKDVLLDDGYTLEFYDNDGYYIPEKFYDVAYLEENFTLRVKKGYSRINEFVFVVSDSIPNTGDNTELTSPILLMFTSTLLLAGSTVLLMRKKKQ